MSKLPRMTVTFVPGVQPNNRAQPRLTLRRLPGATLTPPTVVDWTGSVPPPWAMLANDRVGCCTASGAAHDTRTLAFNGQARNLVFTDAQVLKMYSDVSGYDPADPSTDVGATLQDALNYWRKTGVGDHNIIAFAQIDPDDLDLVRNCISRFGSVYTGLMITEAAMDQFASGRPWAPAPRSRVLGGHCVHISAYTPDTFTCVTWGRLQNLSTEFYRRWFFEAWVPISLEWLNYSGRSPQGLDTAQLNDDFTALTGQPGPFLEPPEPQPAPKPDPCATLREFLEALAKQIQDFIRR